MPLKRLEKLEELFSALAEETEALRAENQILKEEIKKLKTEIKNAASRENKIQPQLERLKDLERSHNKLESERAAVRLKVQNMLVDLEKIDWI